jgi:predicted HAD superfamily Cof-like phosphohydrolase
MHDMKTITVPTHLLLSAIEALRYKAHNEAGQSQAPDLVKQEETEEWGDADTLQEAMAAGATLPLFRELNDVLAFHQKFGVPMPQEPSFLGPEAFGFRMKFMQEELNEFYDDHTAGDMLKAADALVDLVYVTLGTALMMGLPWPRLWEEVQRANMAKERAKNAGESKRGTALDVIKPPGWTAPDHSAALPKTRIAIGLGQVSGWPVFDPSGEATQPTAAGG